jgi:hypothetical protein
MSVISIFGKGNMGEAIGSVFETANQDIQFIGRDNDSADLGEVVVLAVPYGELKDIVSRYKEDLSGKIVVDITNPIIMETFDGFEVAADSSAAQELAQLLPNSKVVKGFNTNFAATLATKEVGENQQTTVLLASDSDDAKATLMQYIKDGGLDVLDVGSLKRARELEAMAFLQMSLAATEQIPWTGGFGVNK